MESVWTAAMDHINMDFNATSSTAANYAPACVERPVEPLFFGIPDKYMVSILPVVAYWSISLFFHFLDEGGYWSKYKIHTPEEFLKRNRVTVREVVRAVLIQHVLQTFVALALAYSEPTATTGCEGQEVLAWASWINNFIQRSLPALSLVGIDGSQLSKHLNGHFLTSSNTTSTSSQPVLIAANLVYWVLIPSLQYGFAAFFVDTWQYFLHRAMHMNRWLYTTFHIRHHRLYVPYAFGALYNHPLEGFILDTVGSAIAFKLSGMNVRQGLWFFTLTTLKTVDDHSGYKMPWNPVHWLTDNDAYYHDIHHQSWGLKVHFLSIIPRLPKAHYAYKVWQSNFSQPFSSFWDRALGTVWKENEQQTDVRYEKGKANAMTMPPKKSQ